jgi:hypothetical protein
MRILNAAIPAIPKFDVTPGVVVTTQKPQRGGGSLYLPHIKLGAPTPGKITCHRVILGARFAEAIAARVQCPREGEALYGFCPSCHAEVAGQRIRRVDEKVDFFTQTREVGKHDPIRVINPLGRGSLILSKEKGTLMLVEERRDDANHIGLKLFIAGTSVKCTVISSDPVYQKIGEMCAGEHWHGPSLVGVDRLLALKDGDRITIQRALPSGREEEIGIEVKASWPRIVSARVIKAAPMTATVTEPVEEVKPEVEPAEVAPELDATIAKMVDELTSAIRPEDSAVEVESIVALFRHVNDPRHIKRIASEAGHEYGTEDLVRVLADPIRRMVGLPLMPEHEGRQFIFKFGKEMKLVGDVVEAGVLRLKTLYGKGNPVDKERNSVDITPKS